MFRQTACSVRLSLMEFYDSTCQNTHKVPARHNPRQGPCVIDQKPRVVEHTRGSFSSVTGNDYQETGALRLGFFPPPSIEAVNTPKMSFTCIAIESRQSFYVKFCLRPPEYNTGTISLSSDFWNKLQRMQKILPGEK